MHQKNYKRRVEKRHLNKCPLCRTYGPLMSAYADQLENEEEIASFECNVTICDGYTTDFVCQKQDGSYRIRECVSRNAIKKPSVAALLDISRSYWLAQNVEDWGIVTNASE